MELIKIEHGTALLSHEASVQIAEFEKKMKEIKEQEDAFKADLVAEMEKNNLIRLDTPEVSVSYIPSGSRETFDSKRFREENPDGYDKYVKLVAYKPSVRIKVK